MIHHYYRQFCDAFVAAVIVVLVATWAYSIYDGLVSFAIEREAATLFYAAAASFGYLIAVQWLLARSQLAIRAYYAIAARVSRDDRIRSNF